MATEPEDPILDAEDEGGPVKGFLEHLEDLRWVLLKSFSALFIAMLVCLFAAPSIVSLLKKPLEQSSKLTALYGSSVAEIDVRLGTNRIGAFKPGNEYAAQFAPGLNLATNQSVIVEIKPLVYGTNNFLTFTVNTNLSNEPVRAPVELLNLTPAAGFFVALQVAFYGGLALSLPFILFFIAQFVIPALKVNELRYIRKAFIFGMGLFVMGVCLCYFGMLPIALKAAVWFSNQMGFGAFQWTADTYIGFVTKFILAMGLGFELPIFILLFVKLGIVDYKMLASNRKIVLVGILVVAAVLTPPDVVTQVAMAIPLYGLFEITAMIAWWWERKDKKLRDEEEAAERAEAAAYKARLAAKNSNASASEPKVTESVAAQPVPSEGEVAYRYSQEAADKAAEQAAQEQVSQTGPEAQAETAGTTENIATETAVKPEDVATVQPELFTENPATPETQAEQSEQTESSEQQTQNEEVAAEESTVEEKTSQQIEEEYAHQGDKPEVAETEAEESAESEKTEDAVESGAEAEPVESEVKSDESETEDVLDPEVAKALAEEEAEEDEEELEDEEDEFDESDDEDFEESDDSEESEEQKKTDSEAIQTEEIASEEAIAGKSEEETPVQVAAQVEEPGVVETEAEESAESKKTEDAVESGAEAEPVESEVKSDESKTEGVLDPEVAKALAEEEAEEDEEELEDEEDEFNESDDEDFEESDDSEESEEQKKTDSEAIQTEEIASEEAIVGKSEEETPVQVAAQAEEEPEVVEAGEELEEELEESEEGEEDESVTETETSESSEQATESEKVVEEPAKEEEKKEPQAPTARPSIASDLNPDMLD